MTFCFTLLLACTTFQTLVTRRIQTMFHCEQLSVDVVCSTPGQEPRDRRGAFLISTMNSIFETPLVLWPTCWTAFSTTLTSALVANIMSNRATGRSHHRAQDDDESTSLLPSAIHSNVSSLTNGIAHEGESGRSGFHPAHFFTVLWRSSNVVSQTVNILWPFAPIAIIL